MNPAQKVLLFGAGVVSGTMLMVLVMVLSSGDPLAELRVVNESNQVVSSVVITDEMGRTNYVPRLELGDTYVVHYYAGGDSTYSVEATLLDGTEVSSPYHYVQSGWKVLLTVRPDGILEDLMYVGWH